MIFRFLSFNFESNEWDESLPNMPGDHQGHGMAFIDVSQTKIIVAGGKKYGTAHVYTSHIYDLSATGALMLWSTGPSLEGAHHYSFATVDGILTAMRLENSNPVYQFNGTSWIQHFYELAIGVKFDTTTVYTGDLYQKCTPI